MRFKTFAAALLIALLPAASSFADQQWVHVKINSDGDENVTVNLPISLMRAAVAMIPQEAHDEMHVAIDEMDMSWSDLLAFWQEVKSAPEATFVTVESGDETVKVRKEGEFLLVKTVSTDENGSHVDVTFPMAVVDALLSGPEGQLNFEAAIDALASYGPGTLVTVRDGAESVRVWIDDQNEVD
jgi:hypothetical protein